MSELVAEKPVETVLAQQHRASGAAMGTWFGCELPGSWGNPAEEQRYLKESVGLSDKNYRAYITLSGPDRTRFLNAIITNDIKNLPTGQGNIALLLNPQGRILAELEAFPLAGTIFCASFAAVRARLLEWLDKFIIMDDVSLTDETDRFATFGLHGPCAPRVVQELTAAQDTAAPLSISDLAVQSAMTPAAIPCRLIRRIVSGSAEFDFIVNRESAAQLWQVLADAARRAGGGPVGYRALNAESLRLGIPWFTYDFGEKQIPHEALLHESHISYSKGCYTGQEIVERVRSRGHVNRQRVSLSFVGPDLPSANSPLQVDAKEIGYVTRVGESFEPHEYLGMGYVRKESSNAGTQLQSPAGIATVVQRPEKL